jgi:hypothetical protein
VAFLPLVAGNHGEHDYCHDLILLTVAALLSADTVRRVITDGQGPQRPPASHFEDPDFIAPTAR